MKKASSADAFSSRVDGFVKNPSVRLKRRAFYFARGLKTHNEIISINRLSIIVALGAEKGRRKCVPATAPLLRKL